MAGSLDLWRAKQLVTFHSTITVFDSLFPKFCVKFYVRCNCMHEFHSLPRVSCQSTDYFPQRPLESLKCYLGNVRWVLAFFLVRKHNLEFSHRRRICRVSFFKIFFCMAESQTLTSPQAGEVCITFDVVLGYLMTS